MDTPVAFLIDAPRTLAAADGETTVSRVQIAKTGKFKDPRYGVFSITDADFGKWMENFRALDRGDAGRAELAIDIDHGPEKRGDTEAAGWIIALDTLGRDGKTATPSELWATVEWNSLGVELVEGRRYRYISPSYDEHKRDETGKDLGTYLRGAALTNRPFLTLATVCLSEADVFAESLPDEPAPDPASDSRARMALSKDTLKKLSLAEDATDEQIEAAIAALDTAPAKTLDQLAGENGKVVLDATEYGELKSNATAGAEAAKELHTSKFETAWDKALDDTKVTPAQKENFEALYANDADGALKILDGLPEGAWKKDTIGATGGSTAPGSTLAEPLEGHEELDEDGAAIAARAEVLLSEGKTDNFNDAVLMASAELGA